MEVTLPDEVLRAYGCEGEPNRPFDSGLVNYSFAIGEPTRLVIQGINDRYLQRPHEVMENLVRITSHLEWHRDVHTERWYPLIAPTADGKHYVVGPENRIWRGLTYLDASALAAGASWETIAQAAELFGRFVGALDDLGGPALATVVPAFRSTDRVREEFLELRSGTTRPASGLDDAYRRAERLSDLLAAIDHETLRRRVVHNDTKLSNCLATSTGRAVAIIDFDLAMEGHVMDDFGDLVRSAAHARSTDAPIEVAERLVGPYVSGTQGVLEPEEIESLRFGPLRVCTQLAWRYLADALRDEPLLRVGGAEAALNKATTNLAIAEHVRDYQDRLTAAVARAVDSA